MHLVYKVLENNPMPGNIPQEMLSSAQRAGVAQGPVPAPLAPPAQMPAVNAAKQPAAGKVCYYHEKRQNFVGNHFVRKWMDACDDLFS